MTHVLRTPPKWFRTLKNGPLGRAATQRKQNTRENYLRQINSKIGENREHRPDFWPDYVKLRSMEPQAMKSKAQKGQKIKNFWFRRRNKIEQTNCQVFVWKKKNIFGEEDIKLLLLVVFEPGTNGKIPKYREKPLVTFEPGRDRKRRMNKGLISDLTQGINPLVTPEVGSICQKKKKVPNPWWFLSQVHKK